MKYYVRVELRDYHDKLIANSDCTCESDISNTSIVNSAAIAAKLMVDNSLYLKVEQKNNEQ